MVAAESEDPMQQLSKLERLLETAEHVVDRDGRLAIEAVAEAAGISRTTAYRLLRSNDELAGLVIARRLATHRHALLDIGQRRGLSFVARLEALMVYTATEFTTDRGLRLLLNDDDWASSVAVRDQDKEVLLPLLVDAQRSGDVRDDLEPAEIMAWLTELSLDMVRHGYGAEKVRRRFNVFIRPAIARSATYVQNAELLADAQQHADALQAVLREIGGTSD